MTTPASGATGRIAPLAFLTGSADAEAFEPLAVIGCPVLTKPFEIADVLRLAAAWEPIRRVGSGD